MKISPQALSCFSIILSIATIVAVALIHNSEHKRVQGEVQKQIAEREKSLVERCSATINQMQTDVGHQRKEIKTLEDVVDALTEIFNIPGDDQGKGKAPKQ